MRGGNLAAYGHADLPFERLVEVLNPARSLSRHPLFQVMLAFEAGGGGGGLELPGLAVQPQPIATGSAKFDLSLGLIERRTAGGRAAGIEGVLEYASDLFEEESVARLGQRLIRLLALAAADGSRALGAFDILGSAERDTILRAWNDTARDVAARAAQDVCVRAMRGGATLRDAWVAAGAGCGPQPCLSCLRRRRCARRMRWR